MKKTLFISLLTLFYLIAIHAQVVYVDGNTGNDKNSGTKEDPFYSINRAMEIISISDNNIYTIKINPGIYVIEKHALISTKKDMTNKCITIEAAILPDDQAWVPEKMPIIISKEKKGKIAEDYNFIAAFLVDENHVTIRGMKFHGYFYPNTRYFPIARFNKQKTDLVVEQCMFVGDKNASHIQVGIIAHGNEIKIDHCVFYNAKNAVVYWEDSGTGSKTGNSFTNNIVYGAFQCAVWFAWPDKDFIVKNNIITNCKHAWIKNEFNQTKYSVENCIVVNNRYYQGIASSTGVNPGSFEMNENNIIKTGEISLRMMNENTDDPLPVDYLHVIPNSLGYDIGSGLFKERKQQ